MIVIDFIEDHSHIRIYSRSNILQLAGAANKVNADRAVNCILAICAMSVHKSLPWLLEALRDELGKKAVAWKIQYAAAAGLTVLIKLHGSDQFTTSYMDHFCRAITEATNNKNGTVRAEGLAMLAALYSIDETRALDFVKSSSPRLQKSFSDRKDEKNAEWDDHGKYKRFLDTGVFDDRSEVRVFFTFESHVYFNT